MIYSIAFSVLINLSTLPFIQNHDTSLQAKNKIDNYEVITISQSGSLFYSVTNQIIESVKNLNSNVTFIGRANVGLESTLSHENEIKISTLENFLYSVSVKTIDSEVANMFYDTETSDVINNGMLVVSSLTAERYQLVVGDVVNFIGLNNEKISIEVGKIIKDSSLGWFEIVVNKEIGYKLGIFRNIQAIIWDRKVSENFFIELHKNIEYRRVKFTYKKPSPNKNWVLPNALVKEMFGDFQIKERDGVWITTEPEWREDNIQNKRMPILGITRCHRLMWEPLEGALNQILEEGLEEYLSIEEWRTAGGCYAPRRISRFDAGGSISRHAWGIAIDINTISGYPPRIVEIFNEWGFAWGGTWTSPDEMHFELRDLSASISKSSG